MQIHWKKMIRHITDDLKNYSDDSDEKYHHWMQLSHQI